MHRLSGAHHPGPAVSDPVHLAADHLGLLLAAVLSARGQQRGRTFQKNPVVLPVSPLHLDAHHLTHICHHTTVSPCDTAVHCNGSGWKSHGCHRHHWEPAAGEALPEGLSHLPAADSSQRSRWCRLYGSMALHFFIGLGALVSPLVVDPFLAEDSCVLSANWTANSSSSDLEHLRNTLAGHGSALHNTSQYPLYTEGIVITRVSYAFWIMAIINLPVPVAVLVLMFHERLVSCSNSSPPLLEKEPNISSSPARDDGQGHGGVFDCCRRNNLRGHPATFFIIHALGGAIVFITDGIIGCYAGFVYTYAVSPPLLMGHKTAGCLDSVFWASVTAGRLSFIFFSSRYTAPILLTISLAGVILVQCLLLIFYTSHVFLFIGTSVLGLSVSSVFPSILAFTEDILDYKGCATTVLVTSASTGEMALQLLVGSVINSKGSYSFLLCTTITSFIGFCLFQLLLYTHRVHRNHQTDSSEFMDMKEQQRLEAPDLQTSESHIKAKEEESSQCGSSSSS
ncbi:major facilitator superfamily domain-containing protein 4A isoform X2 [Girardinichthys multiradiatus]|uniref:major facilitator superfamily domain-containing protein 4A isoform X2 n=1 Tax=Girardinichthys multiradiatus TaxID=208333 RepID=UPI001FABA193|nr:major facilitator superfamily domain-containing protein 4A isoform X2 [Girardinichthys multiradiatus]